MTIFFRLLTGRPEPDSDFDETLIPSSDQKEAMAGATAANPLVTASDTRLPSVDEKNALSGESPDDSNRYITVGYLTNALENLGALTSWLPAVDHNIHYVKTEAGAPSGTPSSGEKLLNTNEHKIYEEDSGSWDSGNIYVGGTRFVFKQDGQGSGVVGGNTTGTHDDKIYEFTGSGYQETTPVSPNTINVQDEFVVYLFNGSNWVKLGIIIDHSLLSLEGSGVYHLTSDMYNGLVGLSSSNKVVTKQDLSRVAHPYTFVYFGGYPADTTANIKDETGALSGIKAPVNSLYCKCVVQSAGTLGATGTLTINVKINGVTVDTLVLNAGAQKVVSNGNSDSLPALQTISLEAISSSDWDETATNITVTIFLVRE